MIRSNQIRTLSAFAIAILLPVAAYAATGTAKSSVTPAPKAAATNATATTQSHPAHMASKTKRAPAVDINSASKEDLMKLPGITDELAQKIIDARPYKSKLELTKKNVLTKVEYGKVRSHVIAKRSADAKMGAAPESKSEEATETKATEAKENKTETGK
jgi:DNA uptake protein ComE-like DNA-binding protein